MYFIVTTRIIVRNLALIKCLVAKDGNQYDPEIQQTLKTLNFVWEQHIIQVRECIETLEGIRDKEEAIFSREQVDSVIENLNALI